MDEEPEALDWGQEEDENLNPNGGDRSYRGSSYYDHKKGGAEGDDAEDAVSLGGDEDDMQEFITLPSRANQAGATAAEAAFDRREGAAASREQSSRRRDAEAEMSNTHRRDQTPQMQSPPPHSSPMTGRAMAPLTHALPPKPVTSDATFLALPLTTAASPMSMARRDKERRANGNGSRYPEHTEPGSDRETRPARGQDGDGYHHGHKPSHEPWSRATLSGGASPVRGRARSRSDLAETRLPLRRDGDGGASTRAPERRAPFESGSHEAPRDVSSSKPTSYQGRHYRSDEAGPGFKREDKLPTGPSRGQRSWVSPERELDRPRPSRSNTHRAPSEEAKRTGGGSSSLPRDDDSRRFIESDSYRAGPTYRPSDTDADQVYNGHRDPPRRPAANYDRLRHSDYEAPPPRSATPPDLFVPKQSAGRSSTLRRRSTSPRVSPQFAHSAAGRQYPSIRPDPLRTSEPHLSRHTSSRSGRAASPPPKVWSGGPRDRDRDGYIPAEAIPQRRGRDSDQGIELDSDAKRRRLDHRSGDSAPSRRVPAEPEDYRDRDSSGSMSPAPGSHSDQSRSRKRFPLPSQTDRYKEMAIVPPQAPAVAPPTAPRSPMNNRVPLPVQPPLSVPSGPRYGSMRSQLPIDHPLRYSEDNVPPPPRSRDRDGRGQSYSDDHRSRDEPMDVDAPYPTRGPAYDENLRRPAVYDRPPRAEVPVRDPPPRAPRAMGARPPVASTPTASPTSPAFPQRLPQPDYPRSRQRDRSPPPPARPNWDDGPRGPRDTMPPPTRSRPPPVESERRRPLPEDPVDRHRNVDRQEHGYHVSREAPREIRGRQGEQLPTGPAPRGPSAGMPANGNSGSSSRVFSKEFPGPRDGRLLGDMPPEENMNAGPGMPVRDIPPRARIPPGGPATPSAHRGVPPTGQRRGPPDVDEQLHTPSGFPDKRVPRYPDSRGPPPRQEPRQNSQRVSRFGPPPQTDAPPPDEQPRIWIPREEAINAQLHADGARRAPSPPARPLHGGGWHKQPHAPYEPRDKPRDKPPYEPRERPPYEPRDRPPYEARDKPPYEHRDKPPYEPREKPPYEQREKIPYEQRDKAPYESRDKSSFDQRDKPLEQGNKNAAYETDDSRGRAAAHTTSQPSQPRRGSRFGPPLDESVIRQRSIGSAEQQQSGRGQSPPLHRSGSSSERPAQDAGSSNGNNSAAYGDRRPRTNFQPQPEPERTTDQRGGTGTDFQERPRHWEDDRSAPAPRGRPYEGSAPHANYGDAPPPNVDASIMGPPETPARMSKPVKIRRPGPGTDVEPEYPKKTGTPSLLDRMSDSVGDVEGEGVWGEGEWEEKRGKKKMGKVKRTRQ